MAERTDLPRPEEAMRSPGTRVAAAVRGVGAGTADLTENVGRAAAAALAGTVRSATRVWAEVVGTAVDGAVAAVALTTRRGRRPPAASGERAPGARRCVDLIDLRTGEQIDEALAGGLAAATPLPRTRAME